MKNLLLLSILFLSVNAYGITGFTYPWIIKANDTVTYTKWKGNNDSVKNWADRACDTINRSVVHYKPSTTQRDSSIKYVKIDTVANNTVFTGATSHDSIHVTKSIKVEKTVTADTVKPTKVYFGTKPTNDLWWQLALGQYFTLQTNGLGGSCINHNTYFSSVDSKWHYRENGAASSMYMSTGRIWFETAPYGLKDAEMSVRKVPLSVDTLGSGRIVSPKGVIDTVRSLRDSTSDIVVSDSVIGKTGTFSGKLITDTLWLNGKWMPYDTGSFACTLKTSDVTVEQRGVVNYTRIGNVVTLNFSHISGTSNSTNFVLYCGGMPDAIAPVEVYEPIFGVTDNSVSTAGFFAYVATLGKKITFGKYGNSTFTASGIKGLYSLTGNAKFSITYMK